MEMLDLINEKDKVIGKATRKEVNEKGLLYRCSGIYVLKNGLFLIQKRSANKKIRPGNWSIVEETVKSGETYEEAALRGVKEELGVKASNLKFIGKKIINDTEYPDYFSMAVFICEIKETPKIDKKEVELVKMITKKDLIAMTNSEKKITPTLMETLSFLGNA